MPRSWKPPASQPPVPLHGKSLLGEEVKQRKYVFAARDKMDETHDSMRAIRSKDYKLILNLMPERPWCQYSRYKEGAYPMLAEMNVLNLARANSRRSRRPSLAPTKPEIELFDLRSDPHESQQRRGRSGLCGGQSGTAGGAGQLAQERDS